MSVHNQVLVAMSKNNQNETSNNISNQKNDETNRLKSVKQVNQNEQIKDMPNGQVNESDSQNRSHNSSVKELNSSINDLNSSNNSSLISDHSLNDSKNSSNISSNLSSKLNSNTISSNDKNESNNHTHNNGHINDRCDLFSDTVFSLKELFRLSVKFAKENENKAFHPTYDDRNYLYALNYQIKLGSFEEDKAPQPGALDFVGKDRRLAWKSLGNLSKEEAMNKFIYKLDSICATFKPFIRAHNQEKVERERRLREEEERKRIEEEKKLKEEEERLKNDEIEKEKKRQEIIREALNKQTLLQFQSYAQEQYPNDKAAQEQLIESLQESFCQQFMQQIMQGQNPFNSIAEQRHQINSEQQQQNQLVDNMKQLNLNGNDLERVATNSSTSLANTPSNNLNTNNLDNELNKINQQDFVNNQRYLVDHEESNEDVEEEEDEEEVNSEELDTDNESTSIEYDNYEGKKVQIAVPQMWTKKIIKQFKESISIDSGDGIIKVGYGETLTIRVPTHPDGNCIVWEFATDNYDIGFGLFFTPNDNPGNQVTIQVSESEDDEEEEDENESNSSDLEKAAGRKENKRSNKTQFVVPIIPVYRRDCFEEVYCGSHVYPCKGYSFQVNLAFNPKKANSNK